MGDRVTGDDWDIPGHGVVLPPQLGRLKGSFSLLMAILLLGGGAIIFVLKAVENIERVEFRGYDHLGKIGVVTFPRAGGRLVLLELTGWVVGCEQRGAGNR